MEALYLKLIYYLSFLLCELKGVGFPTPTPPPFRAVFYHQKPLPLLLFLVPVLCFKSVFNFTQGKHFTAYL